MKPKILLGVTGGIAAYKSAEIASQLMKAGLDVRVIMTQAATKFIGSLTFSALTQQKVLTSIFPDSLDAGKDVIYPHLYPATESDVFVVAPATANSIAKLAHGMADDIVCCSALALKPDCTRIFCPAMNAQMWSQAIVQENAKKLTNAGWHQLGPEKGRLACADEGLGRMSNPTAIAKFIRQSAS